MPTTFLPYFAPGAPVTSTHPTRLGAKYVVVAMKRTNAHVVPADSLSDAPRKFPLEFLVPSTDASGAPLPRVNLPVTAAPPRPTNLPRPGALIRINRPFRHWTPEDVLVVLSVNKTTVSAVKVGGEANPGVRVPFSGVTIVDASTFTLAS